MKQYNLDNLNGKSIKACHKYFVNRGFLVTWLDDYTMEATLNHAGACVKYATLTFGIAHCVNAVMTEC